MAGNKPVSAKSNIRTDLYPPNNNKDFLEFMAEAELSTRLKKFKSKQRATNTRKPQSLVDKY